MSELKRNYIFWGTLLVLSLLASGLCMRAAAIENIPYSQSLVGRGFASLFLTLIFAQTKKLSIWPKRPRTQLLRAGLAGLALSLFLMSYTWLSASTVSVLSNIDVPMLMILGPLIGVSATMRTRFFSLVSVIVLGFYILRMESQKNMLLGLIVLFLGVFLLCFGYLFIKKSMKEENEAVTIIVPSLAIVVYGVGQGFFSTQGWEGAPIFYFQAFLSGLSMFGAYYCTMRLYTDWNLAIAEFPTLLSSLLIQPLEAFILGSKVEWSIFCISLIFVAIILWILVLQSRAGESSNG